MMSKFLDNFIDDMTEYIFEFGYPFVCWEIDLSNISLSVKDLQGNLVKQTWSRRHIIEGYSKRMSEFLAYGIMQNFKDKIYYEEKYYSR